MLTKEFNPGEIVYNLSVNSEGTTVTKIAEIVVEELGLENVHFTYTGGDRGWKGDVPVVRLNSDKIRALGWNNKYTSMEAMKKSIITMIK